MIEEDKLREAFSSRLKSAISSFLKQTNREMRGINTELAKVADVSPRAVNKWLNSEAMPSLSNVYSLANFLGVTPEWLFFGVDNGADNPSAMVNLGYPVIEDIQAENTETLLKKLDKDDTPRLMPRDPFIINGAFFFIRVTENGAYLPFQKGDLLLVARQNKLFSGKYVLAEVQGGLKIAQYWELQHVEIGVTEYVLQTENGIYSLLEQDKVRSILGVILGWERHGKV